jgi:CBS domain-containing protein
MKGHARNLMTSPVTSVQPDAPLHEIARLLASERIGGVPVTDEHQRVVGFVSESDLMDALLAGRPVDMPALALMAHPVHTVDEFDLTDEVMAVLRQHKIHHLPVLRGGRLVGIITPSDVIRFLARELVDSPPAGA